MIKAARMMQLAADENNRAADRITESVRQMQMIFDAGYGGVAPMLLEAIQNHGLHSALVP